MTNKLVVVLLSAALLSACSSESSQTSVGAPLPKANAPAEIRLGEDEIHSNASELAKSFSVECEDLQACNPSVGALFLKSGLAAGRCTSFIAGEVDGSTVIGTNKHCVEQVISCKDELYVSFPSTANQSATGAGCKKLLKVSPYRLNKRADDGTIVPAQVPDYAFIQLNKKVDRPVLPLTQAGLNFSEAVVLNYYDEKPWSSRDLLLRRKECVTPRGRGIINVAYVSPTAPTVGLFDCDVKSGNSGAPVLNSQGQVAAIVQIGPKDRDLAVDFGSSITSNFDFQKMGIATNLSCIELPELGLVAPRDRAACEYFPDVGEAVQRYFSEAISAPKFIRDALLEMVQFNRRSDDGLMSWIFEIAEVQDGEMLGYRMIPMCFLVPEDPNSRFSTYGFEPGNEGELSSIQVDLLSKTFKVVISEEGAIESQQNAKTQAVTYSFDAKFIRSAKLKDKVEITEQWGTEKRVFSLPFCDVESVESRTAELDRYETAATTLSDEDLIPWLEKEVAGE